jgi:Uncharacterised protein family (UPF0158)
MATLNVNWPDVETAFERNSPGLHSYIERRTGEVLVVIDGSAEDEEKQRRITKNPSDFVRIEPASSREQYRWMERFIVSVEEGELRRKLTQAIDGKGAFRRFKDVLMSFPVDRERWFTFRSERLRSCMEAWLTAHGLRAVERPKWRVPSAEEVKPQVEQAELERPGRKSRAQIAEAQRKKLHELIDLLPARELDAAIAFLEFLRERKHMPRPRAKSADGGSPEGEVASEPTATAGEAAADEPSADEPQEAANG